MKLHFGHLLGLSALSIALLVLFSVWSISFGGVDYGTVTTEMMSFILYISMLFRPIRMLADRFNTLQMGMVGSARVFELLDSKRRNNLMKGHKFQSLFVFLPQHQNLLILFFHTCR